MQFLTMALKQSEAWVTSDLEEGDVTSLKFSKLSASTIFTDPKFQEEIESLKATPANYIAPFQRCNKLIYFYILNALYELGWQPEVGQTKTVELFCADLNILPQFHRIVHFYLSQLAEEASIIHYDSLSKCWTMSLPPPTHSQIQREMLILRDWFRGSKFDLTVGAYENIANNLAKILRGNESALSILYPRDKGNIFSAENLYTKHPGKGLVLKVSIRILKEFLQQSFLSDGNKGRIFRVLEVGAGTGSMSTHLLSLLRQIWGDRFELYYTDISRSLLISAKKKFKDFEGNVKYTVFNIEQSAISQNIPVGYFDVVTATDVLHATRSLEESLLNIKETLEPDGLLVFTETIVQSREITYSFGLLDGYWIFEDPQWRQDHCCVGEEIWEQVLNKSGYEDVRSLSTYCDQFACIVATAHSSVIPENAL